MVYLICFGWSETGSHYVAWDSSKFTTVLLSQPPDPGISDTNQCAQFQHSFDSHFQKARYVVCSDRGGATGAHKLSGVRINCAQTSLNS